MFVVTNNIAIILAIFSALVTVLGKRAPLQRFIVEDGLKPPIFGSYSYDPLRQIFDPPPPDKNQTVPNQFYNQTHVLSTVLGGEGQKSASDSTSKTGVFFRKHVTVKTTPWWNRPKLHLNSTMKHSLFHK